MSKINGVVYVCDNPSCEKVFLDPEEVFDIAGITDGEGEELIGSGMLCPQCLLKMLYIDNDILDPIDDASEIIDELKTRKDVPAVELDSEEGWEE